LNKINQISLKIVKLDGSLIPSYCFAAGVGYSGKHQQNGVKLSAAVDQEGLPLSIRLAPGNIHDLSLALPTLDLIRIGKRIRPRLVLADKGYDSRQFRRALRERRIKANIPERQYQRRRKRGRPPRYDSALGKTRFIVERTNSWLKSFRRIHFRFDRSLMMFEAWVLLACIVICLRRYLP
jgi:transposase